MARGKFVDRETIDERQKRLRAEVLRREAQRREPGTYLTEINGQLAYELVCHCGTVNTVFAHRMNFDQHQPCHGCGGLFMPDPPEAPETEQMFRDLARDLGKPI